MKPRFYQQIAVQKTIEAIANNKDRILLTLATGTGKTYIAFQIVYRLFQAKWNRDGIDRRPKILFLADRNVLADQAYNTFNPLEKDIIRLGGKEIKNRGGKVPTNANVFFAIYQSIADNKNRVVEVSDEDSEDDVTGYYRQYPKNFFDLIVIDEYRFDPNDIVVGEFDKQIVELERFEREVIIPKRTELIAKTILENMNAMDKTIVFCVNQKHAMDMKVAIDKFKSVKDNNYCVRVTSDEEKKEKVPKEDEPSDEVETSDAQTKRNEKVTIDIKGKKLKVINIETTYVGEDGIPLKTNEYFGLQREIYR